MKPQRLRACLTPVVAVMLISLHSSGENSQGRDAQILRDYLAVGAAAHSHANVLAAVKRAGSEGYVSMEQLLLGISERARLSAKERRVRSSVELRQRSQLAQEADASLMKLDMHKAGMREPVQQVDYLLQRVESRRRNTTALFILKELASESAGVLLARLPRADDWMAVNILAALEHAKDPTVSKDLRSLLDTYLAGGKELLAIYTLRAWGANAPQDDVAELLASLLASARPLDVEIAARMAPFLVRQGKISRQSASDLFGEALRKCSPAQRSELQRLFGEFTGEGAKIFEAGDTQDVGTGKEPPEESADVAIAKWCIRLLDPRKALGDGQFWKEVRQVNWKEVPRRERHALARLADERLEKLPWPPKGEDARQTLRELKLIASLVPEHFIEIVLSGREPSAQVATAVLARAFDRRYDKDIAGHLRTALMAKETSVAAKEHCLYILAEMSGEAKDVMKIALSDESEKIRRLAADLLRHMHVKLETISEAEGRYRVTEPGNGH